ncbi:hypothetical protein SAMN05421505_1496 [Sinosporangium album]|uniref:Uncharacterized protein n=1 Tax=Sinosporangium album TaxID=504805 RepID=A0A1G8KAK9_9ACTN|nr:hypothetical protein [Sinosporangium album]SDI40423.1 hypothetical protein SAMN05421505_1496 [Sinosporangium album]
MTIIMDVLAFVGGIVVCVVLLVTLLLIVTVLIDRARDRRRLARPPQQTLTRIVHLHDLHDVDTDDPLGPPPFSLNGRPE